MARLQDFQTVTPATSDNLLIVQSQGQGLSTLNSVGQKVATETTISSLNTTNKTLVGAINENKSNIDIRTTTITTSNDNLYFYRCGNFVYFTVIVGTNDTDANGRIIINNSINVIPSGYVPRANCNIWESISGKRVTANSDGTFWVNMNSRTGVSLRMSACWITNDAFPT